MNENQVFEQWRLWRSWTIGLVKEIPSEIVDEIPNNHSNNIRWNVGHVLVGWDHGIYTNLNLDRRLPLKYHLMFPRESSPSEWTETPPSWDEIVNQLDIQLEEIIQQCKGRLDEPLKEPFLHMKTIGELILFFIAHEALHLETIKTINRTISPR